MTIDLSNIFIFKTNIQSEFDKLRIKNVLDASQKVLKWNIDMDDADLHQKNNFIEAISDIVCCNVYCGATMPFQYIYLNITYPLP